MQLQSFFSNKKLILFCGFGFLLLGGILLTLSLRSHASLQKQPDASQQTSTNVVVPTQVVAQTIISPTQSAQTIVTAGWYLSDHAGYSVRYPQNWSEYLYPIGVDESLLVEPADLPTKAFGPTFSFTTQKNLTQATITAQEAEYEHAGFKRTAITIDNSPAVKLEGVVPPDGTAPVQGTLQQIYGQKKGVNYLIVIHDPVGSSYTTILTQILSTVHIK